MAGERALLLYPPGLEYIAAFFGCLYGGAVAVPAYPPDLVRPERTLPRFRAIAHDAQPAVALTTSAIAPLAEALFAQDPALRALRWLPTDDVAGSLAEQWRDPALSSDALAFLQYTSGSTAAPRGVMVSHANVLYNERIVQQAFRMTQESTGIGWLPLYHDMGLIGTVLQPLFVGCPCVLMSPLHFLQRPFRWLQAISRYKGTGSGGPNFAYDLCVRKITPEQRATLDLSSWETAFSGAEPVYQQTLERFVATFEPCGFRREAFYPCYGLAEATLFVSGGVKPNSLVVQMVDGAALEQGRVIVTSADAAGSRMLVSCGRTWLEQQIVIADAESRVRCPPGRIGEIWVSGPSVAQGYWRQPEETVRTFGAYLADTGAGPFLRTGDLGFLQDGELFVTGRLKDLIIIAGRNHYPQDIELTVERSHPALRPGCCAAFSVDTSGEERLIIVAEIGQAYRPVKWQEQGKSDSDSARRYPLDRQEVISAIRRAVTAHHELQTVDVLLLKPRSIPKTSSGKIQRHACRAGYLAGTLEAWE
jgi:acyl-CoA synthetase (AMP-forming)/AMP-acid ligase II